MLALGIVLIVLAVLFALGVSVSSGDSTTMSVFGADFGLSVPTLFFLGVLAGVAVTLGLYLTKKGLGRDFRRRKEVRELRQKVAGTPTAGELEGDRELEADREAVDTTEAPPDDQHTVAEGTDSKQPH